MRSLPMLSILLTGLCLPAAGAERSSDEMLLYFLDMHGGASTLIVTPLGESVLIDTGSLEPKHRDADRIFRAAQDARLERIDHLITTHFHSDHFGGLLQLSRLIPVGRFYDKGAPPPKRERASKMFQQLAPLYREATGGKVATIAAGDELPLQADRLGRFPGVTMRCVAAEKRVEGFDGDVDAPVPGFEMNPPDESDNGRSIAMVLRYGDFDAFLGGDITWNVEHHLAWPQNPVGPVDLYQVTHHGLDQSNNPILVAALEPTVAIAMNGPRKGIQPRTFQTLRETESIQAIYQIHYNTQYGDEGNPPARYIANGADSPGGNWIKVVVRPSRGVYTVLVGDAEFETYKIR